MKAGELSPALAEKLAALCGSFEVVLMHVAFWVVPILRLLKKSSRLASRDGPLFFLLRS